MTKLSSEEIEAKLARLPAWVVKDAKLHREYKFADFAHAIGFLATAAPGIEKMDHHPEWFNVYNKVIVDLTTHSADGITAKDFALAEHLEGIAKSVTTKA